MAFPTTGILDNFNRADENPITSSGWSGQNVEDNASTNRLKILTNHCEANNTGAHCSEWWSSTTFGPDTEAYVTLAAFNDLCSLYARIINPGSSTTVSGYLLFVNPPNSWSIRRLTNGSDTVLASATQAVNAGDSLGFELIGNILKGYQKPNAGSWSQILSYDITSDGTKYTAAGNIALKSFGSSPASTLDDFGGGTIGSSGIVKAGAGVIGP